MLEEEVLVIDVTEEIVGERREEWRAGYESGVKTGAQRVLQSEVLGLMAAELLLLRAVAARLASQVDYWQRKADEFELDAERWHHIAARAA